MAQATTVLGASVRYDARIRTYEPSAQQTLANYGCAYAPSDGKRLPRLHINTLGDTLASLRAAADGRETIDDHPELGNGAYATHAKHPSGNHVPDDAAADVADVVCPSGRSTAGSMVVEVQRVDGTTGPYGDPIDLALAVARTVCGRVMPWQSG